MRTKLIRVLTVMFFGMMTLELNAQTFTPLHAFSTVIYTGIDSTNSDGINPQGRLVCSGGKLYGTATYGGSVGAGCIFALNMDGTGFTNLYSFSPNEDGGGPLGGLVLSGNVLYGTTPKGGVSGSGSIFKINTDGTGFTNLSSFTGGNPNGDLVLLSNTLYGTGWESVFAIHTDGSGFTNLYRFTSNGINGDGVLAGVVLSSNRLYGVASSGGESGFGTVFAINIDGTGFTNIYYFSAPAPSGGYFTTNSDGGTPEAPLVVSGNTLFGTTTFAGNYGSGTIFRINTDGTGFTNIHSFSATAIDLSLFNEDTNYDGADPQGGLVLSGDMLYGTTAQGGFFQNGTLFALHTDGTGFTNLYNFSEISPVGPSNNDGANPLTGLTLSGNTLYGTANVGGYAYEGTVFSLSFTPQLTITPLTDQIVLTWPTNVAGFGYDGFSLQTSTNMEPSMTWTTVSSASVVINGQYELTNVISGVQGFYRLVR